MIRKIIFILAFCLILLPTKAQVFTGGSMSFNYINGLYVDIAPIVGYQLDDLRTGVSPFLSYSQVKDYGGVYTFGGRVFTQYNIAKGVFAHAEFEMANIPESDVRNAGRIWRVALPLGLGYEHEIAKKVTAHAMVLYDVLLQEDDPKENPIFRAGVRYGF